jgi:hypothetical protein
MMLMVFFISVYIWLFADIKRSRRFFGYYSFIIAKKYADKRTNRWHRNWDQSGRIQMIIPFDDLSIVVCSKLELKYYKKRKILNDKFNIKKALKQSYYKTAI